MTNIFRQAKDLLDTKDGREWTEEEWEVFGAAMIPLNHPACPFPEDITPSEGLLKLAQLVEESKSTEEVI